MMRNGKWFRMSVGAAVTCLCMGTFSVEAAPTEDVAAVVGKSHGEVWTREFTAELDHLSARARIANASYATAATAFRTQRIDGSPAEAARLVLEVIRRVDRGLRRGESPGKVLMDARRAVARLKVGEPLYGASARMRLGRQLSGMGALIYGELEQRAGPQGSPGFQGGSMGTGSQGGGSKGKSGTSSEGTGELGLHS